MALYELDPSAFSQFPEQDGVEEISAATEARRPSITLLKELEEGKQPVYHFFVDGEDSKLTMTREMVDGSPEYTYRLKYEDWEYGEVDVYCGQETATVDWQGIIEQYKEGQRDSIAEIEALNFLNGAGDFVLTAIRTDFPGLRVEDGVGNHL